MVRIGDRQNIVKSVSILQDSPTIDTEIDTRIDTRLTQISLLRGSIVATADETPVQLHHSSTNTDVEEIF